MPIDHVNALPPGTRFEEYRLDAALGAGGFGITYRAYDANLDKFVAIKEYLPVEFATRTAASTVVPHSDADAQDYRWGLTRFLDEARTLARFDHSHLNKVHRFFESNGTAYMVLEYVEGEMLADRLTRERQLPEESLQRLLEEVLSGLEVMHEAGYVHRDIKPGNLMLREEDGSAVILDFGAARQAVGQRSKAITSILTPGYAPVEQYDGKVDRVGAWTDMYALGMVAYRCISGIGDSELPDAVARMLAHTRGEAVLLPAVEAGKGKYNPKLLEAIDWAMEVDEGDRPQTVDAWRGALAGGSRGKSPAKSVIKPATQRTGGTTTTDAGMRWLTIALTAMIVALLGIGGWWAWQHYPDWVGQALVDTPAAPEQTAQTHEKAAPPDATETAEIIAGTIDTPGPDKAEAEQPVSKELALSPQEADVARLLAAAEADLKARRLTSPVSNNAWDRYKKVLELEPANPDAIKGMERVIETYMELVSTAVEQEDFGQAESYLERIRDLHPDSPSLLMGRMQLEDARQARADRLAAQGRQRQADLERQRIAEAVKTHWKSFDSALATANLNEAADILHQIRTLNPEEPELAAGEQRLEALRVELERQQAEAIQAHWAVFDAAIETEDLDKATDILTQIRDLNPEEPGLTAGEQRLVEAQAELERKRQEALKLELAGEMVSIPGGTFRMGDLSGEGDDDEKPVHSVTVPTFMMGKHEVTVGQFRRFVEATEYRTDAERNADGKEGCSIYTRDGWKWTWGRSWRSPGYSVEDDHPVVCVSWNDAQAFIEWLTEQIGESYRLTTEAEWEYAARAGSATKYHFGDSESQLCRYANHADSSTNFDWQNKSCSDGVGMRTAEVGRYQPNNFGLYDVHGNVNEWLQDCWNENYQGAPVNGSVWKLGDCGRHVTRGGSWYNNLWTQRSSDRHGSPRSSRTADIGFRLAQDK